MHTLTCSIRPIARRAWRTSAAAIVTAILAACTEPATAYDPDHQPAPVTVARIDLTGAAWILEQGTASYTATIVGSDGNMLNDRPIAWASSDTTIASVNNGVVFAKRTGEVTLSAAAGGKAATLRLVVRALTVDSVIIRLGGDVFAGESGWVGAELRAADGRQLDRVVSWASLDPSIATVDAAGHIRGLRAGVVDIVATSEGRSGTLRVAVRPARASGAWTIAVTNLRSARSSCTATFSVELSVAGAQLAAALYYDMWTGLAGTITCERLPGATEADTVPPLPSGPLTGTIQENGYVILKSGNGWQLTGMLNRESRTWTGSVIYVDGPPVNGIVPIRGGAFSAVKR